MSRLKEEAAVNPAAVKKFAVAEGKHAKFRCFVTGKPKPEIIWKKNGVPLEPGRRHLIFEDREGYYTLKVLYCKEPDTGLYVCAASNALGNTLSAVHLSVKGKRHFDMHKPAFKMDHISVHNTNRWMNGWKTDFQFHK